MNPFDLGRLSKEELKALEGCVESEFGRRKAVEMAAAREQIEVIAKNLGLPLVDILGKAVPKIKSKEAKLTTGGVRHPDNADLSWTGRGRHPRWLTQWLEAGGKMESLMRL